MLQVMSLKFRRIASHQFNCNLTKTVLFASSCDFFWALRYSSGLRLQWLSFIPYLSATGAPQNSGPPPQKAVNFRKNYSPRHRTIQYTDTPPSPHITPPSSDGPTHPLRRPPAGWCTTPHALCVVRLLSTRACSSGLSACHAHCCVLYLVTHAFSPL